MRVLRPARRIHIRRRGRVLRNSPPPASVRSANRPEPWPRLAPSGVRRGARGLGLPPAPCAAAPVVFAAIRAAMLRRRDTVFSPCDVSHRASDEPRRCMSLSSALAPSSLASPSIRCVFFAASALADVPSARLTLPRHIRTPHSATTLATAFGSDLRSVDTLRSSLRSPNPMPSARAHQRYACGHTQVKNIPHRILTATGYHRILQNAVVRTPLDKVYKP